MLAGLLSQSANDHIQDKDFQIQRLTKATLQAVARYRVHRHDGPLINIVASQRQVDSETEDTRHRWEALAGAGSCTIYVPAEDSGRLFVSPYVEEVARQLEVGLQRVRTAQDDRGAQVSRDAA